MDLFLDLSGKIFRGRSLVARPPIIEDLQNSIRQFWREQMTIHVCNKFIDHVYKVLPITAMIGGRATRDLPRKIFPERSRNKSMKYFADKLKTEEYQQNYCKRGLSSALAKIDECCFAGLP
jgi:hypothetical protein